MTNEKFTFFSKGSPFSNFFTAYFKDKDGVEYSCTEQFYMAKKALFFKDEETYKLIMEERRPHKQKRLGRKVKDFSEDAWYGDGNPAKKFMFEGNYYKYSQNNYLLEYLFKTKDTFLVEASYWDDRWGIGMEECPAANNRVNWKGKNWLGEVLTEVREILLKEEESKNYLF
jgi:ribA/ribD-fused uncharacterized protein